MKLRAIVSDIDGTLLREGEPTEGLRDLSKLVKRFRPFVRLVYATGRTFQSTWHLIQKGILPIPDAVASLVGTEVWFPPWSNPSKRHASCIDAGWNRAAVEKIAHSFRSILEPQDEAFQSRYKVSYYLHDPSALPEIKNQLRTQSVKAQIVFSCDRYLDFLPLRAGKNRAADYCCNRWHIPTARVLACGDSGNDFDMLIAPEKLAVVVGNAENTLRQLNGKPNFHISNAPYAMGVLEGAESFQFWSHMGDLGTN